VLPALKKAEFWLRAEVAVYIVQAIEFKPLPSLILNLRAAL